MLATIVAGDAGNTVDLESSWSTLWSSISSEWGQLSTLLTIIGLLLVVFAFGKYIFDRRRGGGGHAQGLTTVLWTLVAGSLLAAPDLIIPAVLSILDYVINGIGSALTHAAGS